MIIMMMHDEEWWWKLEINVRREGKKILRLIADAAETSPFFRHLKDRKRKRNRK